jgi:hypothetical protein
MNKRINKFYSEFYKYSPYLYQLQRMQQQELISKKHLKAALLEDSHRKVHLVLNGQPHTLLPLANQLIRMRNILSPDKITHITATGHHAVASLLFALGLDDETFTEELLGLEQLVRTHSSKEGDNVDLV